MKRVNQLRVRGDWGFVRIFYVPAFAAGLAATKLWPAAAAVTLRINPCFACEFLARWGHHVEEWANHKPLLEIRPDGLLHEDGGEPEIIAWERVIGISVHRRNPIPPWRTDGATEWKPPFWLAIHIAGAETSNEDSGEREVGGGGSAGGGYVEKRDIFGDEPADYWTITVWPRQVEGGLMRLMRFSRELQRTLVQLAEEGRIPMLTPGTYAREA